VEIDDKIARVKELIAKREDIDGELSELLGGTVRERRSPKCSVCGERGHRATTCSSKKPSSQPSDLKPASAGFFVTNRDASSTLHVPAREPTSLLMALGY